MPRIQYVKKRFASKSRELLDAAIRIMDQYEAQGYKMTVRQLYYRLVATGVITRNTLKEYKKLVGLLTNARLGGYIDWDMIEDRLRYLRSYGTVTNANEVLDNVAQGYMEDIWNDQDVYVEVWFEKDALIGVFERIAHEVRVPFFSCRGYNSVSEMWVAAQRLAYYSEQGKAVTILHLGDHDPSGIDMTRDIRDRLSLFSSNITVEHFDINRLALNMDQVEQYNPPPNPAKIKDSRFHEYAKRYGTLSWELDALEPTVLAEVVRQEVNMLIDTDKWQASLAKEAIERDKLKLVSQEWNTLPLTEEARQRDREAKRVLSLAQNLFDPRQRGLNLGPRLRALRDAVQTREENPT